MFDHFPFVSDPRMQRRPLLTALAAAPLSRFAAETKPPAPIIRHTGRCHYRSSPATRVETSPPPQGINDIKPVRQVGLQLTNSKKKNLV